MILVTGATGQVGRPLVEALVSKGHAVRAVVEPGVTSPWSVDGSLDGSLAGRVDVVRADFDDVDAIERAAMGADRIFMLVPPGERQVEWQRTIVHAARQADLVVKLSAFDSRADSRLAMGRWHHEGEEALEASGVPHVVLRPQYFFQNLLHDEASLRAGILRTFIPPGRAVGMVDAHDVAAVAAAVLDGAGPMGGVLVPTGPAAITTRDVAAAVAAVTGVEVRELYLPPDQAMAALLAMGRPQWHADDTVEICQTASAMVNDCVPALVGRPARDLTTVVAQRLTHPVL